MPQLRRRWGRTCSNARATATLRNFGLMSVAEWEGIPLAEVVAQSEAVQGSHRRAGQRLRSHRPECRSVRSSAPAGCSRSPSLDKLGAFLAVRMNGEPVPADHGKPVRLAVPGWYGCTWIKWVNEIRLVGPDEPATTADGGVRQPNAPGRAAQVRAGLHAGRHPDRRHAGPRRKTHAPPPASNTASSASCGVAPRPSTGCRSGFNPPARSRKLPSPTSGSSRRSRCAQRRRRTRCGRCGNTAGSRRHRRPTTSRFAVADAKVPQRRLETGYYIRQVKIEEV